MILLTQLKATAQTGNWSEPRGVLSAVQLEPVKGFFIQVRLGESGLTFQHGADFVGIPVAELLRLAQTADPALVPPGPGDTPAPAAPIAEKPTMNMNAS